MPLLTSTQSTTARLTHTTAGFELVSKALTKRHETHGISGRVSQRQTQRYRPQLFNQRLGDYVRVLLDEGRIPNGGQVHDYTDYVIRKPGDYEQNKQNDEQLNDSLSASDKLVDCDLVSVEQGIKVALVEEEFTAVEGPLSYDFLIS